MYKKMVVIRNIECCDEEEQDKIFAMLDSLPIEYETWESDWGSLVNKKS